MPANTPRGPGHQVWPVPGPQLPPWVPSLRGHMPSWREAEATVPFMVPRPLLTAGGAVPGPVRGASSGVLAESGEQGLRPGGSGSKETADGATETGTGATLGNAVWGPGNTGSEHSNPGPNPGPRVSPLVLTLRSCCPHPVANLPLPHWGCSGAALPLGSCRLCTASPRTAD